jgi:Tfp pilus assembly PilM family ATPase
MFSVGHDFIVPGKWHVGNVPHVTEQEIVSTFLALDWDHNRLHLVAATVGNRGEVRLHKVLVFDEPDDLTVANAEAAGQRLSKRLKEARVAPGPVLACLGRERVVFKEIRYPIVGLAEEPAIVRFQASKELTEPAETVVLDYSPLHGIGAAGERRALLLVARRPQVEAYKKLCQAAGLKLVALTPRPFGIAACLKSAAVRPQKGLAVAILTVSERWAEFAVVGGEQLLFARPVPTNGNLIGEVRRNLALYAGQPVHSSRDNIQALYLAGNAEQPLLRELQDTLAIPVHALDPLAGQEQVPFTGDRAGFTGAVGLLYAWARQHELPVNFVAPKEPKAVTNVNRQKLILAGAAGCLCLIAAYFVGMLLIDAKKAALDQARIDL